MRGLLIAAGGFDSAATAALVLAVITLLLLIATMALVASTREEASRAREDALRALDLLRRELGSGHRPMLVDVLPTAPPPPDMDAGGDIEQAGGSTQTRLHRGPISVTRFPGLEPRAFDPRTVFVAFEGGKIYVSVPLRNVGRDVAVIDDRGVELTGPLIGASEFRAVQRHHVPEGETTRLDFTAEYLSRQASDLVRQGLTMRGIAWQLAVPYDDFAGAQRTVAGLQIVCRGDDVSGPWVVERVEQRSPHIRPSPHALESSRQEEPRGDEPSERRPDAEPERRGVRGERVVDLWGNPVRPRRRRR